MKSLRDEIRLRRKKRTDLISSKRSLDFICNADFTLAKRGFHYLNGKGAFI